MGQTGFVYHPAFLEHDMGISHPESPDRLRSICRQLERSGTMARLVRIEPRRAEEEWLMQIHTPSYVEALNRHAPSHGRVSLDPDTSMSSGSLTAAYLAAGGALAGVDAIMAKQVDHVFCAVRPPGHHAEANRAMGFCLFNNVAIAARYVQRRYGVARVLIVDWDVHHGNGTQWAFYEDPSVLTISIHQDGYYPPDSGSIDEVGDGDGKGYNLNIPLPAGSGHGAYIAAIERVILPALRAFNPELIIVPSGFDANVMDPLGRMLNTSKTYTAMTLLLKELAHEICHDRLLMVHEGGYSTVYVPFCGLAVMEALSGLKTGVEDPYLEAYEKLPGQELQPHQDALIIKCEELAAKVK